MLLRKTPLPKKSHLSRWAEHQPNKGTDGGGCYMNFALVMVSEHMLSNHIAISEKALKERAKTREGATSFVDYEATENAIIKTLTDDCGECSNAAFIKDWVKDNSDGEDIDVELYFDEPVGYGFINSPEYDWNEGAVECFGCRVVLAKDENMHYGFRLKTAYPIV